MQVSRNTDNPHRYLQEVLWLLREKGTDSIKLFSSKKNRQDLCQEKNLDSILTPSESCTRIDQQVFIIPIIEKTCCSLYITPNHSASLLPKYCSASVRTKKEEMPIPICIIFCKSDENCSNIVFLLVNEQKMLSCDFITMFKQSVNLPVTTNIATLPVFTKWLTMK